ncbi:MAG TPA: dienelactone hydrolase family protein, partial [Frankiaceae bacterium]|nr:dienelactone hydrolase family protein [Frankiaceae bacterium]
MTTRTVHLPTPDGPAPAYAATPEPGEFVHGGVVIQDARGITPYLESVCQRLAVAGWHTLAPHLFHRDGISMVDPADGWAAALPQMLRLTGDGIAADVDACLAHLVEAGLPFARSAVVGFCMGGSVALFTAARRPLGAAVSFYGGGVTESRWPGVPPLVSLAPELRAPWLGLYGQDDDSIPVAQAEELGAAALRAPVPTELVLYPGAGHAFHSDDRPGLYRPQAAADAWRRALSWLD